MTGIPARYPLANQLPEHGGTGHTPKSTAMDELLPVDEERNAFSQEVQQRLEDAAFASDVRELMDARMTELMVTTLGEFYGLMSARPESELDETTRRVCAKYADILEQG